MVDTKKLTNGTVRKAIEALQTGDREAWLAVFSPHVLLTDDGSPRSFSSFTNDALGHERFTSIDSVHNDGMQLIGRFHSEQWGDFNTYFRFHLGADGKIERLEIGQVDLDA